MTKNIKALLGSEEFIRFLDALNEFCTLLRAVEATPTSHLLQQVDRLLPLVYSTACVLPEYPWDEDEDYEDAESSDFDGLRVQLDMRNRITAKLGELDRYSVVFDAIGSDDREVVGGSLAEDLSSVFADLLQPLKLFQQGDEPAIKQAIWDWGFGRKIHWGRHAVHAMNAVYSLVHQHYDGDEERFDVHSNSGLEGD